MTNGNAEREVQMITRLTMVVTEEIADRRCDSETRTRDEIAGKRCDSETEIKDDIASSRSDSEIKSRD